VYGKGRRGGKDRRGDYENGKPWKLLEQLVRGRCRRCQRKGEK
jgi:hypothetical protein